MFFLGQREILNNLLLLTVVWIVSVFNYYMINLQVKYFPGNFTVNMIVMFGTDIPAAILAGYFIPRFQAKILFVVFFALQSFAGMAILLGMGASTSQSWVFPALVAIGRFGNTACFTGIWIAHPKMFPTLFAVTSLGISNFAARTFVIIAPIVAEIPFPLPMIVYTILTLLGGIASLFIVEKPNDEETAKRHAESAKLTGLDEKLRLAKDHTD